eukprot:Em0522g1a
MYNGHPMNSHHLFPNAPFPENSSQIKITIDQVVFWIPSSGGNPRFRFFLTLHGDRRTWCCIFSGTNSKVKPADVGGGAGGPVIVILETLLVGLWESLGMAMALTSKTIGVLAKTKNGTIFTTSPAQAPRELARK